MQLIHFIHEPFKTLGSAGLMQPRQRQYCGFFLEKLLPSSLPLDNGSTERPLLLGLLAMLLWERIKYQSVLMATSPV